MRLQREFYQQDTISVAIQLLGKVLVRKLPSGELVTGMITETEAYLGNQDPACHTFDGHRSPRVEAMYGEAGTSYVYLIYGIHSCLNVVTVGVGVPEAVLIRAVKPLDGLALIKQRRGSHIPIQRLTDGPGKLCDAFSIDRRQNALDLVTNNELWLEEGILPSGAEIIEGPRIGIGNRHDAVHWPLRFRI